MADGKVFQLLPKRSLWAGIPAIVAGIICIWVGLGGLTESSSVVRGIVAILGIAIGYWGLNSVVRYFKGENFETSLWLAIIWVVVLVLAAIFADLLPLQEHRNTAQTLRAGTETLLRPDLFSVHPFGTDRQALDILGGVIYGARVSLQVSVIAITLGIVIGGTIGTVAGFFRGKTDAVIGVFTDTLLSYPPLILLLALVTVLEPTPLNMAAVLAALGIPTYIRISRANTLVFAQREFVLAARAMGANRRRIIFRELVPNVALPLLSYAFIIVAVIIVAEASLSFLGIGIQRPEPTWGNMIAAGQDDFDRHPHLVFIPGGVMFLTVFALNRIGEKARQLWDPREANI